MPSVAIPAAIGIGSALIGGSSARSAARTQADATRDAANLQAQTTQAQLDQQQAMYDANVARLNPFVQAGLGSLSQLQAAMQPGGQLTKQFDFANFQQDPSYQFRVKEGLKALQASAAAKGRLGTGQGMEDIINYGQQAGSQEAMNAFNRFQTQNDSLFNRLRGVAGDSQNAAAGLGAQGTQVSSNMANTAQTGVGNIGNLITSGANAQAAGQIGSANAVSGALGQAYNQYMQGQYLQSLGNQGGGYSAQMAPVSSFSGLA